MNHICIELETYTNGTSYVDGKTYYNTFYLHCNSNVVVRGKKESKNRQGVMQYSNVSILCVDGVSYKIRLPYKELVERIKMVFEAGGEEE